MNRRQQRMAARFGVIRVHEEFYPNGRYYRWTTGGPVHLHKARERAHMQWVRIRDNFIDLGYMGDDDE